MTSLMLLQPAKVGDWLMTRRISGQVALVSAYSANLYWKAGMEVEFTGRIWYSISRGIKVCWSRRAILMKANMVRLESGKEMSIEALGPYQDAKIVARGRIDEQLYCHGMVAS